MSKMLNFIAFRICFLAYKSFPDYAKSFYLALPVSGKMYSSVLSQHGKFH